MNATVTVQVETDQRQKPTFIRVLAGEPSEAEVEERYLALARFLLRVGGTGNQAA